MLFSALLVFILCAHASAASDSLDSWKTWKKGCDVYERGESLMLAGKYEEALTRFKEALNCFNKVKEERPQWSRRIIDSRVLMCTKKIDSIDKYLTQPAEIRKKSNAPVQTGSVENSSQTSSQVVLIRLKKELEASNAELQKYKEKLFASVVEVEDARKEIELEKRRSEQARKSAMQLEGLFKEKNEIEQKYAFLNATVEALKNKQENPSSKDDGAAKMLAAEKQKYEKLSTLCDSLGKEAAQYKERFGKAAAERTLLIESQKNTVAEIEQLKAGIANSEKKFGEMQKSAEKSAEDLIKLDKEYQKIIAKNKELSSVIAKLDSNIKKLRSSPGADTISAQLSAENDKLKNDNADLKKKLDSLFNEKNSAAAELEKKKTDFSRINNLLATVEAERKKLKDATESYRSELEKKNRLVLENNQKMSALENENKEYGSKLNLLAEKYNDQRSKIEARNTANLTGAVVPDKENEELKGQISSLNEKIDVLQKTLTTREEEFKSTLDAKSLLEKKNAGLNSKIQTFSSELQEEKAAAATREKALNESLDSARKNIQEKEKEVLNIMKNLDKIKKDISSASTLDSKKKQELSESLSELKMANARLEKELAEARTNTINRSELLQKDKAMSALIEELKRARESNRSLQRKIDEMKKQVAPGLKNAGSEKSAPEEKKEALPGGSLLADDKLGVRRAAVDSPNEAKEKAAFLIKSGLDSERQNDIESALWHYKKAIQADPDNFKALKNAARSALKLKDYSFASESSRQAMKMKSSDIEVIHTYAESSFKLGELEEAAKAAERLLPLSKNNSANHLLFADICLEMGKVPAAELNYKRALELDPACGKAAMGLARIYSEKKEKWEEGMKYYRKALELKEKPVPELELLYSVNSAGKKEQGRLIIIKRGKKTFFIKAPPVMLYGAANPEPVEPPPAFTAIPEVEKKKADSGTFDLLMTVGENAEKEKNWRLAVWSYSKASVFTKDNLKPRLKEAEISREKLKRHGKAMELYEKILKDFPDEPHALTALGIIFFEQGKHEKALQLLNTAVLIEPGNASIQRYQGLICLRLGKREAAEQMLLKAFKTDPKSPEIAFDLARLYTFTFKTRLNEGAKWYKKAKELGAEPDKVLESFYPEGGTKKKAGER